MCLIQRYVHPFSLLLCQILDRDAVFERRDLLGESLHGSRFTVLA
jgi:hypothetical protein